MRRAASFVARRWSCLNIKWFPWSLKTPRQLKVVAGYFTAETGPVRVAEPHLSSEQQADATAVATSMKTLLLLRHAKSSWADNDLSDHDRPLNERGKHQTPRVGEILRERQLVPDVVLSSTAKRARKTAGKVLEAAGCDTEITLLKELYLAPPAAYVAQLRKLPDACQSVLVVGHNPGLEQLLESFIGEPREMGTACLAQLELPLATWSELELPCRARLVWFGRPEE